MEDSIKLQKEAVKRLQEQIKIAEKMPVGTDLTPVASLVDTWTGSNFAKTYQPPTSDKEKMDIINTLNKQIGASAHNIASDELDILKTKLMGKADVRAEAEARRAKQQELRNAVEPITAFNKDPLVRDTRKSILTADRANAMVDLNNPLSASFVPRALARMAGEVGVMTDQDVASFKGSKAWLPKYEQIFEEAVTGKLTSANRQIMKEAISKMAEVERIHLDDLSDRHASQFAPIYGVDPVKFKQNLAPELTIGTTNAQPNIPPQSTRGPQEAVNSPSFTPEQIEAEIARRGL